MLTTILGVIQMIQNMKTKQDKQQEKKSIIDSITNYVETKETNLNRSFSHSLQRPG